jgi:hypothetical protein
MSGCYDGIKDDEQHQQHDEHTLAIEARSKPEGHRRCDCRENAGRLTISPAVPSLIRSAAISGKSPTGRNSVVTRAKAPTPILVTAANEASGLRHVLAPRF